MEDENMIKVMPEFVCHDVLQRTRISSSERRALRKRDIDNTFMDTMKIFEGTPVTLAVLGEGLGKPCACIDYIKSHPEWSTQCHGLRHIRYDLVDSDKFTDDMLKTCDLIESVFGNRPTVYIPPYNKYTRLTRDLCGKIGLEQKEKLRKPGHYKKAGHKCKQVDFHYWSESNMKTTRLALDYFKFSPHYIIGAPRSGTTALMRFMSDEDTVVLKERESLWIKKVNLRDYYKSLLTENKKHKIVDKNVRNSFRILNLKKQFPNAKFTHIIRDGRAAISSWRDWARKTNKTDQSIESAAKQWLNYVTFILNNKHELRNYEEVRYEELCFKEPYFVSRNNKWKTRLTKQELDIIMQIAGALLRKLGYV